MELLGSRFGHIRIVDVLGEGGMGSVYSGFDETLHRKVAVKALHRERRLDAVARARLMREARSLSQLDHPNICRIYDYIEGEDVDLLVLELIEGKTLQKAIDAGLPRAEKIRIACDIAKVLEVAHRRGIVHRDLKPDNVMLTAAGEVKVLDFGLARWLDQPAAAPVLHTTTGPEDDELGWAFVNADATDSGRNTAILDHGIETTQSLAATAAGITLGTPLYMSPEQARGERLTPASDMFSFGLLLQTLFTGREPYAMDLLGSEVMRRAARGESLPMTGDHAVTALVNRLKQLAPTDRLTAHEVVERLQYIADAPKRTIRRAIALVIILAAALGTWKYTFDLQRERAAAVAAQHEAERRRAQANGLIGFMLGDLRTKLDSVGRLDVLNDVGERALSYFSSLNLSTLSPAELSGNARALYQLGDVRLLSGRRSDAMVAFHHSLDFARAAVRKAPKDERWQFELGQSLFWLGKGYLAQEDLADALVCMSEYLRTADQLAAAHPANPKYQLEVAFGHSNVGLVLEQQGKLEEASNHYLTALKIKQRRASANVHDLDAQAELARAFNKIGFLRYKLGDLAAARQFFENENAIYQRLVTEDPRQMIWKQRQSVNLAFLGRVLEDSGAVDLAANRLGEERALDQALVTHDPANRQWQRNLAITTSCFANLQRIRGDAAAAVGFFAASESMLQRLVQEQPAALSLRRDLATVRAGYARALLAKGESVRAAEKANQALEDLTTRSPKDRDTMFYTAHTWLVRGDVASSRGATSDAAEAWNMVVKCLQPYAGTSDVRAIDDYCHGLVKTGRAAEARPLIERLRRMGYRNPDFLSLCNREGC